jgi:hypothetical protein
LLLWLQYRRDLWLISKEAKRIRRRHARTAARGKKDGDDLLVLADKRFEELARLDDERSETVTIYLVKRANALGIPCPDYLAEGVWEISHKTGMHRLNENALASLQIAVRNEKEARLRLWERRTKIFAPAATAVTGLIGALIGLMTMVSLHR